MCHVWHIPKILTDIKNVLFSMAFSDLFQYTFPPPLAGRYISPVFCNIHPVWHSSIAYLFKIHIIGTYIYMSISSFENTIACIRRHYAINRF